ncbi:MAG: aconitase family protein [Planctomycetaceae bacterium]
MKTIIRGGNPRATRKAFSSIAIRIGTSNVAEVLATQTMFLNRPKVRKSSVRQWRTARPGVYAKDVILFIIQKLGVQGGVGYAYRVCRIQPSTPCRWKNSAGSLQLSIEGGARCRYINPDQKTVDYLKGKTIFLRRDFGL